MAMLDKDPAWWRQAVVYQIYPRSFADGNGDGLGDFAGILSRVDYLRDLGVDAVWLSPFYPSALADGGYDVDDYRDVDPRIGTLAEFDALVAALHGAGLRVIVDIVPNHTSNRHVWFQEALASAPGSPARERYIFRDGVDGGPPSDWRGHFGGPAWQQVPDGQWYLHFFAPEQPDLNWSNPEVREDFLTTLRFWSDRGADGFRVDVANMLAKDMTEPLRPHAELFADGFEDVGASGTPSPHRPRRGPRDLPRVAQGLQRVRPSAHGSCRGVGAGRTTGVVRVAGGTGTGVQLRPAPRRLGCRPVPYHHRRQPAAGHGRRQLVDLGAVQPRRRTARDAVRIAQLALTCRHG